MSIRSIDTEIRDYDIPYFKFPKNPNTITIEGYPAYEYITPQETSELIKKFSYIHNLKAFDHVCVNLDGGLPFAKDLIRLQNYREKIVQICYKENGQRLMPIPEVIKGSKKILILDDVLDQFITGRNILEDAPAAKLWYMTKKRGVLAEETDLSRCSWASEVDNQWLLGKGMNGELDGENYPKNWGRKYEGIAVKILPG